MRCALSLLGARCSLSRAEGAGDHARPWVDGRPPARCLRCLSKRSESRQPWLQASVSTGFGMCSYSTLQTKRPQPVGGIDPLQTATKFNTFTCVVPASTAKSVFVSGLGIVFPHPCLSLLNSVCVCVCTQSSRGVCTAGRRVTRLNTQYRMHKRFIYYQELICHRRRHRFSGGPCKCMFTVSIKEYSSSCLGFKTFVISFAENQTKPRWTIIFCIFARRSRLANNCVGFCSLSCCNGRVSQRCRSVSSASRSSARPSQSNPRRARKRSLPTRSSRFGTSFPPTSKTTGRSRIRWCCRSGEILLWVVFYPSSECDVVVSVSVALLWQDTLTSCPANQVLPRHPDLFFFFSP